MERDTKPAVVFLRMSQQLREGLRHAANEAGCSLNAFAVQALAAAAGDPARFRAPASKPSALRDLEMGSHEMVTLVKRLDAEDPGHFVEWARSRAAE